MCSHRNAYANLHHQANLTPLSLQGEAGGAGDEEGLADGDINERGSLEGLDAGSILLGPVEVAAATGRTLSHDRAPPRVFYTKSLRKHEGRCTNDFTDPWLGRGSTTGWGTGGMTTEFQP